ncbi:MAG: hypothetical protein IPI67_06180 [Myxococcales bacterium]|nr:hypothetical protein [Myxococcales bacterium]
MPDLERLRLLARASRLFAFRAVSSTFAENRSAARQLLRAAARDALPEPGPVPITIVLLSYRRPWNTPLQAHVCLSVPGITRVIVSHNDPARAPPRLPEDPRLRLVVQPRESGPITRYQVLRDEPGPWFVAIDDDLFLSPLQLTQLVRRLVEHPEVPHGVHGQLWKNGQFTDNVTRADGEVDLLNRVYAFSAAQLARYFELLALLELTDEAVLRRLDDDIVLSFCGSERPRIHDLGPMLDCPSERRRGALWRRKDALERRTQLLSRLEALTERGACADAAVGRPLVKGPRWFWSWGRARSDEQS